MGASDSKLVFKKGIFRLSEERHIAADDPYWTSVSLSNPVLIWLQRANKVIVLGTS
jgi:hypothetical protein